ncbi:MAG: hypothetical protein QOI57_2029 [Rubrobacteraceae bacterium]|jgi:hypothetical protein|nr:hypothetical protein [Rubrobacteraceae bacterium]
MIVIPIVMFVMPRNALFVSFSQIMTVATVMTVFCGCFLIEDR